MKLIVSGHFPWLGTAREVWSFIHVDDAAQTTDAAIERATPGSFNIVDDEPVAVGEWLPTLARLIGARPPRHIPAWLARIELVKRVCT